MISIIIPAYNEGKRLGVSLQKLADFLVKRDEEFEVIVVDDASTDNTSEIAESFKDKIPNLTVMKLEKSPFAGKGLAVNKGMLAAKGEIALFTDADFSTPIDEIDKLLNKINNEGSDIAIGSRALDRSTVKQHQNILRELMGRTFNILVQIFTVRGIVDTQCGFKAFKLNSTRSIFEEERIFDFGFDVELLFAAQKKGLKIVEVPVLWYNDRASTVNPIVDSTKMFLDLIKIRLFHGRLDGSLADKFYYLVYHYRTFWRFCIVGVTNTVIDIGILYLLTRGFKVGEVEANRISVETAILWSFFWNNLWTFSERKSEYSLWKRFLSFQYVSLGGYVLNQILFVLLIKFFLVFDLLAKVLVIPPVLVFNYVANSKWVFHEGKLTLTKFLAYLGVVLILFLVYLLVLRIA